MLSLLLLALFYPQINGSWSIPGEFPEQLLMSPDIPFRIPAEHLQEQKKYYLMTKDPVIRARIIRILRDARNSKTYSIAESLLRTEKSPELQADLLSLMYLNVNTGMAESDSVSMFRTFLKHPSGSIRAYSARLLILADKGLSDIADMLMKEETSFVPGAVYQQLEQVNMPLSVLQCEKLAKAKNPEVRTGAIAILTRIDRNADGNPLIQEAMKDPVMQPAIAKGAAKNPEGTGKLAAELAESSDVTVRSLLAESSPITPARIKLLFRLLNDESSLVRQTAAASLGSAEPQADVINALAGHLADSDRFTRQAAAESLVRFAREKLLKSVLANRNKPAAHEGLLKVISASRNPEYAGIADEIYTYSEQRMIPGNMALAVKTLGVLANSTYENTVHKAASAEVPEVRAAAAIALQSFPGKDTAETLKKLLDDKMEAPFIAAAETVHKLQENRCIPALVKALNPAARSQNARGAACWALAAMPGKIDSGAISGLNTLLLKACIPNPMGPPAYESGSVRAFALMTLFTGMQSGNEACRKAFDSAVHRLNNPTPKEKEEGFEDDHLKMYMNEMLALRDGGKAEKVPLPVSEPEYVIGKYNPDAI